MEAGGIRRPGAPPTAPISGEACVWTWLWQQRMRSQAWYMLPFRAGVVPTLGLQVVTGEGCHWPGLLEAVTPRRQLL
jgi:hypothetical protein